MSSSKEKEIQEKLKEAEKSYRNSYIIAGVVILFMAAMMAISFYPLEVPKEDEPFDLSTSSNSLSDITLEKKLFAFDIPVDMNIELETSGGGDVPDDVSIYFLKKDEEGEHHSYNPEELKAKSVAYGKNVECLSFSTSLEPDTPYTFVVRRDDYGNSIECRAVYSIDTYPLKPYIPFFIAIGVIGCAIPFTYILLDSKKRAKLERELAKKKRKRAKKAQKGPGPFKRPTSPPPGVPGQPGAPVAYESRSQKHLQYALQQLHVVTQQETVIKNQLRFVGPREQKMLLLKRYGDIQAQKRSMEQQVVRLRQESGVAAPAPQPPPQPPGQQPPVQGPPHQGSPPHRPPTY